MKKLLSIAVATIAFAAFAGYTPQRVGVTAITTTNKNTIVAVPFTSLAGGNISAAELVKTTNLSNGTYLVVFQDNTYTAWILSENQWIAFTSASTVAGIEAGIPAGNQKLNAGDAIWVVRPASDADAEKTFYIYGTPSGVTSKTISSGSNLIANPLQATANISVTPTLGDEVVIPNDVTSQRYVRRYSKGDKKEYWVDDNNAKLDSLPSIPQGLGVWYITSASKTVSWMSVE